MRTGQKHCKLALLTSSVALMVGVTSLVVYLAWMVTVQGHVTGTDIEDRRHYDSSNGIQSSQVQEINIKDTVSISLAKTTVETQRTNKVRISDRRRRKKLRKNPNDILNLRKSRKAKDVLMINQTEDIVQNMKDNGAKNSKKRKNIYGFKKRKSKKAFEKAVKLDSVSIDESDSDTLSVMKALGLGFNSDDSRIGSTNGNHRNKTRSSWGDWTSCSVECGLGQQERVRSCGANCQEIESKPCLIRPCKGAQMTDKWAYFEMFDLTEREVTSESGDACEMWMKCSNKSIHHYLSNIAKLPSCPCFYPISLAVDDKVYDGDREQHFSWEDASGPLEKNNVYRPGAKFCIRSRLPEQSVTLAAQHCCYDNQLKLITRGRDAGTPNLVSPQLSRELHKKVDILPWVICKGDWTRYNMVIQPNNYRQCSDNPCLGELQHQLKLVKSY